MGTKNMYVYIRSEPELFTVGYYVGETFCPESDWEDREAAARRVAWLNGRGHNTPLTADEARILGIALGCYFDSIAAGNHEEGPDDSERIAPLQEVVKFLGGLR